MSAPRLVVSPTLNDRAPTLDNALGCLLDHADLLEHVDARLFLSQADLRRLLDVSAYQAEKLFKGPLWDCTVPVGTCHRRIFLPALLRWMEERLGTTLYDHDMQDRSECR